MTGIGTINLKVIVIDTDYYSQQAINSYLAWDRRTRVTLITDSIDDMWEHIHTVPKAELPDVVVIDANHLGGADGLKHIIHDLLDKMPELMVVCLAQFADPNLIKAAAEAGARAYMLKQDVRLHIAWAICYAIDHDFVLSAGVTRTSNTIFHNRISHAQILPGQRQYPDMTDRIRQAIKLCVIEGMPAYLAADEMGISLNTIRGYIRDGYRILESHDHTEYPADMTPQECAFMRFTALETDNTANT
jgi:DNA-binding NarL/FixJ family response regulator